MCSVDSSSRNRAASPPDHTGACSCGWKCALRVQSTAAVERIELGILLRNYQRSLSRMYVVFHTIRGKQHAFFAKYAVCGAFAKCKSRRVRRSPITLAGAERAATLCAVRDGGSAVSLYEVCIMCCARVRERKASALCT